MAAFFDFPGAENTLAVGMSQLRCAVSYDSPSLQRTLKIVYPKF
jgi:hypothetical protein